MNYPTLTPPSPVAQRPLDANDISMIIWDMKYRLKTFEKSNIDKNIEDTWQRIAKALAKGETDKTAWQKRYLQALHDFQLMPAGRISRGAGTKHNVTLVNTFVMRHIPDDLGGIMDVLKESAQTLSAGGGIGLNFSGMRPAGAHVRGLDHDSSGPISFMRISDETCRTIMSAGEHRGAMMAMLACDHPDIEQFITAKQHHHELRHFNLSVLVTDVFMQAVETDSPWDLQFEGKVYKTLPARELWQTILDATYQWSEPGVLFIDTMNRQNKLGYQELIIGTNSCGEQPLPEYGSCPLGSINLAKLVDKPFTPHAALNLERLEQLTAIGIRMLDTVLDITRYPLQIQKDTAARTRRVGLGVTGLADALLMCNLHYSTETARNMVELWLKTFRRASYAASIELAKEKGAFPAFDLEAFSASEQVRQLDDDLINELKKHGIRNGALNSIAPTGTSSLYAGNISSGIEPVYSFESIRKILLPDGSHKTAPLIDYALHLYRELHPDTTELPSYFVGANDLKPEDHLAMQALVQRYIDGAIAKTINCPESMPRSELETIYLAAYKLGCKGCTTYRPSDVRGQVIQSAQQAK